MVGGGNRMGVLRSVDRVAAVVLLQCHQVPHGALLGAFSYELRRDPPIRVEKSKAEPLQ
jgi:hypothetical protein